MDTLQAILFWHLNACNRVNPSKSNICFSSILSHGTNFDKENITNWYQEQVDSLLSKNQVLIS